MRKEMTMFWYYLQALLQGIWQQVSSVFRNDFWVFNNGMTCHDFAISKINHLSSCRFVILSIIDGKKWDEDSEHGKLLMAKSISRLGIKMSFENQLFCEIYKKNYFVNFLILLFFYGWSSVVVWIFLELILWWSPMSKLVRGGPRIICILLHSLR